jgi:hypothetical protein
LSNRSGPRMSFGGQRDGHRSHRLGKSIGRNGGEISDDLRLFRPHCWIGHLSLPLGTTV